MTMMYMRVLFSSRSRGVITRAEVVELPDDIKNKGLSSDQITTCDKKAKSLCHKGERVSGWKLLEEYEANKLKEKWAMLDEPWYNLPILTYNIKDEEEIFMDFNVGEPVIYQNGDKFELGIIKTVCGNDEYFVNYHTGDTAARTHARHLHKISNSYAFHVYRLDTEDNERR